MAIRKETFKPVREYKFKKEQSKNKQVQFVIDGSTWVEFVKFCDEGFTTPSKKLRESIYNLIEADKVNN